MNSPEQLESISPASQEVEPREIAVQEIMETRREAFLETFKGYSERKIVDAAYVGGVIKDKTQHYLVDPAIRSVKKKIETLETASDADRLRYAATLTGDMLTMYLARKGMGPEAAKVAILKYGFLLPEISQYVEQATPAVRKFLEATKNFAADKVALFTQANQDAAEMFHLTNPELNG